MRCGDFYETYGVDSVMLVAYAGLNSMGGKCRAGCPIQNIQATLDCLTEAGLSVAMYEELPQVDSSKKSSADSKLKTRALVQIVSPASRTYLYDLSLRDDQSAFRLNRPIVGITETVGHSGYTLCALHLDEKRMTVMERLSPEAVRSLLDDSGHVEPVYLQGSVKSLPFLKGVEVERVSGYSEAGFLEHVMRRAREENELPTTEDFAVHKRAYSAQSRPVYTSTAMQIGLLPNNNVPSLVQSLLPRGSSDPFSSSFWSHWLVSPPPHSVADHMRNVHQELCAKRVAIPEFTPVALGKVVSFLSAGEASVSLFRDIRRNAQGVSGMLSDSGTSNGFIESLLAITSYQSDVHADRDQLLSGCDRVVACIERVVAPLASSDPHSADQTGLIPSDFFRRNEERFRGRVLTTHAAVSELYGAIHEAAQTLCVAVGEDFAGQTVHHDIMNNALVGEKKKKSKVSSDTEQVQTPEVTADIVKFSTFVDRRGRSSAKNRVTTSRVRSALSEYLELVESAPLKIKHILRELSDEVGRDLASVQQATHWAVIVRAANAHTASALQKKWCLPSLVDFPPTTSDASSSPSMEIAGLTPYWLDRSSATMNDLSMRGLFLLTAPNMSGKSTLMRSVLVAALLANCGLFVPCTSAVVPRYDNFFLRTSGHDVPSEGKSAFALEIDDMRVVLRDCSEHSLVMIDELGKGTSSRDGTALSGALLEDLARRRVHGIFSTHLHELFRLNLSLDGVRNKRMAVDIQNGHVVCTYTLQDGTCTDSMALVTARQYGIAESLVRRAEEIGLEFDDAHQYSVSTYEMESSGSLNGSCTKPGRSEKYDLERDISPLLTSLLPSKSSSNEPVLIASNFEAPASLEGQSCVYVLHIHKQNCQSKLYVGETESVRQRLARHRAQHAQDGWSVDCLAVPVASKSSARSVETRLIKVLKRDGYYLHSGSDATHSLFGSA
eukprot:gene21895-27972_t